MIDWMALQGVNLPLSFNGQEAVYFKVYKELGLTDEELWSYFSGPAFLPWNRMGNMQAFGALNSQVAGLDKGWMDSQFDLQVNILKAMRLYGMTPVLPGFAGHVPAGLMRVFPNASFTHSSDWCRFNKVTTCLVTGMLQIEEEAPMHRNICFVAAADVWFSHSDGTD